MSSILKITEWSWFKLTDLFVITGSKTTPLKKLNEHGEGEYFYVTTQATNNGIAGTFNFFTETGNVLTVDSAVTGYCSYQPKNFAASDHVEKLIPKFKMNKFIAFFLTTILNKEQYRYNYGRKAAQLRLKSASIKLPSKNKLPDWEGIERFIKSLPFLKKMDIDDLSSLKSPLLPSKIELDMRGWQSFRLDTLFEIQKGKRLTKEDMNEGETPFIGAIDSNNGWREFIGQQPNHRENTITVNYNGSVAEAFYQPIPFWASDDVNVLYPKFEMNVYMALFIIVVIKMEKYRFNFGRKWHKERMDESEIKLPAVGNKPDFELMEKYIKTLPYSGKLSEDKVVPKQSKLKARNNKKIGLSDEELIEKYESGKINLKGAARKMLASPAPGIAKRHEKK